MTDDERVAFLTRTVLDGSGEWVHLRVATLLAANHDRPTVLKALELERASGACPAPLTAGELLDLADIEYDNQLLARSSNGGFNAVLPKAARTTPTRLTFSPGKSNKPVEDKGDPVEIRTRWGEPVHGAVAIPDQPPIPWRVKGLWRVGEVVQFHSRSGVGKSLLALTASIGCAAGIPIFVDDQLEGFGTDAGGEPLFTVEVDGFRTKQCGVLYLDLEMNEALLKQRVHAVAKGLGVLEQFAGVPFQYLCLSDLDLNFPSHVQVLKDYCEDLNVGLVVIDPMGCTTSTLDIYLPEFRHIILASKLLCDGGKRDVLIMHHENKTDGQFTGTTAIRNTVDEMFAMAPVYFDGDIGLEVNPDKHRNERPRKFQLRFRINSRDAVDSDGQDQQVIDSVTITSMPPVPEKPKGWTKKQEHIRDVALVIFKVRPTDSEITLVKLVQDQLLGDFAETASTNTVRSVFHKMEQLGLLAIEEDKDPETGTVKSRKYRLVGGGE